MNPETELVKKRSLAHPEKYNPYVYQLKVMTPEKANFAPTHKNARQPFKTRSYTDVVIDDCSLNLATSSGNWNGFVRYPSAPASNILFFCSSRAFADT